MNTRRFSLLSILRENKLLIIPLFLFSMLFLPFVGVGPCYDAAGLFDYAKKFLQTNMTGYLLNKSLHPPFVIFLLYLFFLIGGVKIEIVSLVGYIHGIAAIVGLYFLEKTLFDKHVALISALLLSVCPIFLANGLHLLMDYAMATYIIIALYFYLKNKILIYMFFSSMAVLTKETALLLPLCILLIEVTHHFQEVFCEFRPKIILRMIIFITPLLIYSLWLGYVKLHGLDAWSENIFTETKNSGAFVTVIYNVLTLNFFNEWAIRHRLFLFVLNFNWVYFSILGIGIGYSIKKGTFLNLLKSLFINSQKEKTKLNIIMFSVLYLFTVFALQTFPAPRYTIIILVFVYLAVAAVIRQHIKKIPLYFFILFSVFIVARLYYSIDPLSILMWDRRPAFDHYNQLIYKFDDITWGNDAILYNLQYLIFLRSKAKEVIEYKRKNKIPDPENPEQGMICATLIRGL